MNGEYKIPTAITLSSNIQSSEPWLKVRSAAKIAVVININQVDAMKYDSISSRNGLGKPSLFLFSDSNQRAAILAHCKGVMEPRHH